MREVTVDKANLVETLKANKARHEELFHEASKDFYERLMSKMEYWEQKLGRKEMNFSDFVQAVNRVQRDQPQGHCDEYQEALDMLEYEVNDTVILQAHEFAQFVGDKWNWQGQFAASYTANTGKFLG